MDLKDIYNEQNKLEGRIRLYNTPNATSELIKMRNIADKQRHNGDTSFNLIVRGKNTETINNAVSRAILDTLSEEERDLIIGTSTDKESENHVFTIEIISSDKGGAVLEKLAETLAHQKELDYGIYQELSFNGLRADTAPPLNKQYQELPEGLKRSAEIYVTNPEGNLLKALQQGKSMKIRPTPGIS